MAGRGERGTCRRHTEFYEHSSPRGRWRVVADAPSEGGHIEVEVRNEGDNQTRLIAKSFSAFGSQKQKRRILDGFFASAELGLGDDKTIDVVEHQESIPRAKSGFDFGVTDFFRFIASTVAVVLFIVAGQKMLAIESQGAAEGNVSINEVFYQAMGYFSFGMAALSAHVGIPRKRNS